ncbi:putative holin [Acinetobacter lwoffii]|uniref:putative holin n=1 Tax=Acinetobacter lwoffii TaxID=28090 RepID=UPI00300839CE
MTEPASASGLTVAAGVGLASLLPFVNGDALIGAVLGAAVVAIHTKDAVWYLKIVGLFLSSLCGYFFAPDAQVLINVFLNKFFGFEIKSIAVVSCLLAVVSVPFLKKLSDWAYRFDLAGAIDSYIEKRMAAKKDKEQKGE